MESIVNTFSYEMEYGGPHVHFLAFFLFIFIGIVILHGVFRIVIEVLSRVTKIPRDSWRNIFRFMPTLMGILFILSSYGISISPLLTALGAGGLASALAAWHRPWPCRIHWPTSFPALRRWYRNRSTWAITSACPAAKPAASSI